MLAAHSWGIMHHCNRVVAIVEVLKLRGQVQPEPFKGHECCGFEDGASNPEVMHVINRRNS